MNEIKDGDVYHNNGLGIQKGGMNELVYFLDICKSKNKYHHFLL